GPDTGACPGGTAAGRERVRPGQAPGGRARRDGGGTAAGGHRHPWPAAGTRNPRGSAAFVGGEGVGHQTHLARQSTAGDRRGPGGYPAFRILIHPRRTRRNTKMIELILKEEVYAVIGAAM